MFAPICCRPNAGFAPFLANCRIGLKVGRQIFRGLQDFKVFYSNLPTNLALALGQLQFFDRFQGQVSVDLTFSWRKNFFNLVKRSGGNGQVDWLTGLSIEMNVEAIGPIGSETNGDNRQTNCESDWLKFHRS